jgi:hypothetical protein
MANDLTERSTADFQAAFSGGKVPAMPEQTGKAVASLDMSGGVITARRVEVKRDLTDVLNQLRILGGAAGESWYYRFPVRNRKENRTDHIEGPSIKLANDLARIYGNCEIDVRMKDETETHWTFYARFSDYETGFNMTRAFRQRKSQRAMGGDEERGQDIAFQIGQSKAIRNVVVNALQTFSDFAFTAAKESLVEAIGKDPEKYRQKLADRFREEGIPLGRVERIAGKAIASWTVQDMALRIGELRALTDGLATADELYSGEGQSAGAIEAQANPSTTPPPPPAARTASKPETIEATATEVRQESAQDAPGRAEPARQAETAQETATPAGAQDDRDDGAGYAGNGDREDDRPRADEEDADRGETEAEDRWELFDGAGRVLRVAGSATQWADWFAAELRPLNHIDQLNALRDANRANLADLQANFPAVHTHLSASILGTENRLKKARK